MRKLVAARRVSQTFFLLAFIYILWSTTFPLRGLLPPGTFFMFDPLITFFTSVSERLLMVTGLVLSSLMIIFTLVLGRFFCGWICPLGTMIDLSGSMTGHGRVTTDRQNDLIRKPKFLILSIVAVAAAFGAQIAWLLDPMVIMGRFVSLNLIPSVTLVVDRAFISALRLTDMYQPLYDVYRGLRSGFLGVKVAYFANSGVIFFSITLILLTALALPRFWCRSVCPLGALYAFLARYALLERVVKKCVSCGRCAPRCRTGAIWSDPKEYSKGECILCMDCIYECASGRTVFRWRFAERPARHSERGITRKHFLFLLSGALMSLGASGKKRRHRQGSLDSPVIRPPYPLKESEFIDRCIRCGNCMKVCPTNGLQPVMFEAGAQAIWTPRLVPEIGYCEYYCTLCGNVCPTGAIVSLPRAEKIQKKLGVAKVHRHICIAWRDNAECIVCEEHCPVKEKAIKVDVITVDGREVKRPVVDTSLCVGCGICQNKCPVRPERAIRVSPRGADKA
ncbi:MAG: 4Fe-4S binding protein [Candidatus Omnitrophica bacterium]|nr:4Fe-4S binding protein [Candidatus Omnitrophota bacterium]